MLLAAGLEQKALGQNSGRLRSSPELSARFPRTAAGLVEATSPAVGPSQPDDRRFREAATGAAIGAAIGTGVGLLAIAALNERDEDALRDTYGEETDPVGLAVLAIAGGPPIGAVLNSSIQGSPGVYALSTAGELVLGGLGFALGYGIGSGMGTNTAGVVTGAILAFPGVAFGAAGGAVIAAPGPPDGAIAYDGGQWRVGLPPVGLQRRPGPRPGVAPAVALFSVEL